MLARLTDPRTLPTLRLDWESTEAAWLPIAPLGEGVHLHPGLAETLPALLDLIRTGERAELHAALYGS